MYGMFYIEQLSFSFFKKQLQNIPKIANKMVYNCFKYRNMQSFLHFVLVISLIQSTNT